MKIRELGEFPNYTPPSWDKLLMRLVYEYASKSKDPSSKIGAIIVQKNRPVLFGYNGFPEGVNDTPERLNDRSIKLPFTEHAERNAVDIAARLGIATEGGILYTPILPCSGCAKAILQARIVEVVLHRPADDYFRTSNTGTTWVQEQEYTATMFRERGMKVRYVEELIGSVGYLSGKMIAL